MKSFFTACILISWAFAAHASPARHRHGGAAAAGAGAAAGPAASPAAAPIQAAAGASDAGGAVT